MAEDLGQRAGFERCALRVSRTLDMCDVMSVRGDSVDPRGVPLRPGDHVANADVKKLLAAGVAVGALTFVAVEWRGTDGAVLPAEPTPWQDGDFVIALVRDDDGRVRASVLLDRPSNGLRPTEADLVQMSEDLHPLLGAVLTVVENEDLTHQLAVARQMRELVRELDHRTSLDDLLTLVRDEMRVAFRAEDVTLYLDADGESPSVGAIVASEHLHQSLSVLIQEAWLAGDLLVVESDETEPVPGLPREASDELHALMAEYGIGTLAMVPVAADSRCLGTLGVVRGKGTPRWTSSESRAAVEVGRDLGRAVLNARRYEREQQMRAQLERLDAYRTQMISTISHELKNPIGVIQGHLELLDDSGIVPEGTAEARSLEAITRGAERLATLADDLLVLSRVGDTETPMERTAVDLGQLVREAVEFARVTADRAGVSVSVTQVDVDVSLVGNREALSLVVSNLISNAVKYTDAGGTVSVQVLRRGSHLLLICRDTGLGISPADQKRIFREFFRSTNPDATSRPGTGLGLVILKRVVERHGGHVEVESVLGEGTTFRVTLPSPSRVRGAEGPAGRAERRREGPIRVEGAPRPKRLR